MKLILLITCFAVITFCFLWKFSPVKSIVKEIMYKENVPAEFSDFPVLAEAQSSSHYAVTLLQGAIHFPVQNDANGNYIIGTMKSVYTDDGSPNTYHFYSISPHGEIIGQFQLPQDAYPNGDLIIVPENGTYSTWLTTGDKIFHQATPISNIIPREEFMSYYDKADNVLISGNSAFFHINAIWYFARTDFYPDTGANPIKDKHPSTTLAFNSNATSALDQFTSFSECPQYKEPLLFSYFERTEYISSGLLNTGVNINGEHWNGFAYLKLRLYDFDFSFKYPMQGFENKTLPFVMPLKMYINDHFALFSGEQNTVLIQARHMDSK